MYLLCFYTCTCHIDLVLNRARHSHLSYRPICTCHILAILLPSALVVESNLSCFASTLVGLSRGVDVGSLMNFVMCRELCIHDVGLYVGLCD
jgi:hypothetical protein